MLKLIKIMITEEENKFDAGIIVTGTCACPMLPQPSKRSSIGLYIIEIYKGLFQRKTFSVTQSKKCDINGEL